MNQREATQQNRWPLLAHPARDTSPAWSSRTELPASGNARRQQRNGSTVPVTGEIMPTPRQSASVDWVKIFDPTGTPKTRPANQTRFPCVSNLDHGPSRRRQAIDDGRSPRASGWDRTLTAGGVPRDWSRGR